MRTELIGRIGARLRRDAGVSLERTFLYTRSAVDPTPITGCDVDLRIATISATDAHILAALGSPEPAEWEMRFARGDACFGAWHGAQLVHCSWVQLTGTHPIDAAGVEVGIRPFEFWIYNCRTSDVYRGKRIYPRTLQHIAAEYFRTGRRAGWIYTARDNVASQHGIGRAGFSNVGSLRALRIGRRYQRLGNDVMNANVLARW